MYTDLCYVSAFLHPDCYLLLYVEISVVYVPCRHLLLFCVLKLLIGPKGKPVYIPVLNFMHLCKPAEVITEWFLQFVACGASVRERCGCTHFNFSSAAAAAAAAASGSGRSQHAVECAYTACWCRDTTISNRIALRRRLDCSALPEIIHMWADMWQEDSL